MKIELNGDALKLFEDFLKYGRTNTDEMTNAMWYDKEGFITRLIRLQRAYDKANKNE